MSKYPCELIEDILPLYVENSVTEQTRDIVNEHLQDCPKCEQLSQELLKTEPVNTELKESLPQADTFKRWVKRLKKVSIVAGVLFILFMLGLSFMSYKAGSTSEQDNYKVRDVVNVLQKEGLSLTKDRSFDGTNYKIENVEPTVYKIENKNQYLLIYPFPSMGEREKVTQNWNETEARKIFTQEGQFNLGYTAKNMILVFVAQPFTDRSQYPDIQATLEVLGETIFFDLNKGTEVLYRGESQNWEAGLIVTYYENWWKDEQGKLQYEPWSNTQKILKYKGNPDEVGKNEVHFEHPGGSAYGTSESFTQGSFDVSNNFRIYGGSPLNFGHLGGNGAAIPRDGTFKVTIKWNDNQEETIELKPESDVN